MLMTKMSRSFAAASIATLLTTAAAYAEPATDGASFTGRTEQMREKGDFTQLLSLPAGKQVVATTDGDKHTDVHLFVSDAAGAAIGQDISPGPQCNVTFTPVRAGVFKFVVKNEGPGVNNVTFKVTVAK